MPYGTSALRRISKSTNQTFFLCNPRGYVWIITLWLTYQYLLCGVQMKWTGLAEYSDPRWKRDIYSVSELYFGQGSISSSRVPIPSNEHAWC